MAERKASKSKSGNKPGRQVSLIAVSRRDRYFGIVVISILLILGSYHSVLYFGHKLVPTSDLPGFVRTGHELLSFQIPSNFKRTPVVGLLQAGLSYLVGGQTPDLTAGRLVNAILYPLIAVLLWLVGKRIIGTAAVWFAIIVIINPWIIYSMTDPIAETTLLFFVLLSVYFIFRRSRWSYLFASLTSMVRYEGAALIVSAFVIDVITNKSARERIKAFSLSALASVPLGVWLLGTMLNWESQGESYYLKVFTVDYMKFFSESASERTGLTKSMKLLWQIAFYPLFLPVPGAASALTQKLMLTSQITVSIGSVFGSVYALIRRKWEVLALLIFFVPYIVVHAMYPYPLIRFYTTVGWIALLVCILGMERLWQLINKGKRIPKAVVIWLQLILLVISAIWIYQLFPFMAKFGPISPRSKSFPYVAIAVVAIVLAGRIFLYRRKRLFANVLVSILLCLIIMSNQLLLVRVLGDGKRDAEFVQLANWYINDAKPDEKMAIYLSGMMKVFAPGYKENFVGLPKADNRRDFVQKCYEQNITYVVWASREMRNPNSENYKMHRLDNIDFLFKTQDVGPYRFVTQIGSKRGYVNVFRLRPDLSGLGDARRKPPEK